MAAKKIKQSISAFFLRNNQAEIIEALIDTTVEPDSDEWKMIPFLNLWAWEVESKSELTKACKKAKKYDDSGFFYDVLEEINCHDFKINLSAIYSSWPDDADQGDDEVIRLLQAVVHDNIVKLAKATHIIFHHVDTWPALNLRTGKPFIP